MTRNHSYETPTQGTPNWHRPLNENFRKIDTDVEVRDVESQLGQYEPKSGAKFLATDVGHVYVGDGQQWRQVGSYVTDSVGVENVNGIRYANQYSGTNLTKRVQAAIDDLPGRGKVIVPPKADGRPWEWESWWIDPTEYDGIQVDVFGKIRYAGDDYMITIDTGGDIPTQIQGATFELIGGHWHATGNPAGFVRTIDLGRARFEPRLITGFTNSETDSTVYSVEIDSKWSENSYYSGIVHVCDIGIEFKPSSNTSFVDNTVEGFAVGAKRRGVVLRGNVSGVEFSNFTYFPRAEGAVGVELDGRRLSGCQFNSPRFDNVGDFDRTAAFASTENYRPPGPLVLNPVMPTLSQAYEPTGTDTPLFAIRPEDTGFYIDNLHPDGGTLVVGQGGQLALYDREANQVFKLGSDGTVLSGGDHDTGRPTVFNDNVRLNRENLTRRDPVPNEIAFHDGSGGHSGSLCFYTDDGWYSVVDDTLL